ncbi:MAG TPA: hypothetical protein VHS74_12495 [Solirubrobacterales bacterium]|jgi:hypothetical protein|nr:hypothetical protein [Solirubrobacterales bacterium]
MARTPDPEPNPPAEPDPEPPEPAESLADTEGELQDFLGGDRGRGEERLDLSQDRDDDRD